MSSFPFNYARRHFPLPPLPIPLRSINVGRLEFVEIWRFETPSPDRDPSIFHNFSLTPVGSKTFLLHSSSERLSHMSAAWWRRCVFSACFFPLFSALPLFTCLSRVTSHLAHFRFPPSYRWLIIAHYGCRLNQNPFFLFSILYFLFNVIWSFFSGVIQLLQSYVLAAIPRCQLDQFCQHIHSLVCSSPTTNGKGVTWIIIILFPFVKCLIRESYCMSTTNCFRAILEKLTDDGASKSERVNYDACSTVPSSSFSSRNCSSYSECRRSSLPYSAIIIPELVETVCVKVCYGSYLMNKYFFYPFIFTG